MLVWPVAFHSHTPDAITAGVDLGAPHAALSVAALTATVIRIRAPAANSISIDPPLLGGATGQGVGPASATTIAGMKPGGSAATFVLQLSGPPKAGSPN
ncbi:hypothetical protein ACFPGQ_41410 [Bradyrhizobium sp. GCM10023181]|nr:hypothetical protein [Bradyrhizobium zhengyangense]